MLRLIMFLCVFVCLFLLVELKFKQNFVMLLHNLSHSHIIFTVSVMMHVNYHAHSFK